MDYNFGYMFNKLLYDDSVLEKLDKYSKDYENKSNREILSYIEKLQADVSNDIKLQHIKNLELLSKMEGFTEENAIVNIKYLKRLLKVNENVSNHTRLNRNQYVSGSSLLLWFLLVTLIYRRPFGRRRPFRRY
ncbi:MAG: hypothetical protein FH753_12265 [Firmicutes bacterium]|nr:hypothetical protein [Bacillota bacterium]